MYEKKNITAKQYFIVHLKFFSERYFIVITPLQLSVKNFLAWNRDGIQNTWNKMEMKKSERMIGRHSEYDLKCSKNI